MLEPPLLVRLVEGRALHGPQPRADADGPEPIDDALGLRREHDVGRHLDRVEAAWIARLGQEPLGARRIVRVRGRRPVELEVARDDARRRPAVAEVLGVAERLAIERQVRGQTHALIGPR